MSAAGRVRREVVLDVSRSIEQQSSALLVCEDRQHFYLVNHIP